MNQENLILQSDSYKYFHWAVHPPDQVRTYSYLESRGGVFPATRFFGLQYYLMRYLCGSVVTRKMVDEAEQFIAKHMGPCFNRDGWDYIVNVHNGHLPVVIRAVPEGTLVGTGNVLMTMENTDPNCHWLTNWLETLLMKVWYPTTVCTLSYFLRNAIETALHVSGTPELVEFKLHDFGYRGVSSEESAALGAAAHLVNFRGTDTLAGIRLLQQYYGAENMPGLSIPATEHSIACAFGPDEGEVEYVSRVLDQAGDQMVAVVGDSYDIFRFCRHVLGERLKDRILARTTPIVVRPDSGDPVAVLLGICNILKDKFGFTLNDKGYVVLHPNIRIVWGDGISHETLPYLLRQLMGFKWSIDNFAFGCGGGLLQKVNRDTQKFAFKASDITFADGSHKAIFKDPVTDPEKRSKTGRLRLVYEQGQYITKPWQQCTDEDCLRTVFQNGELMLNQSLAEIRQRPQTDNDWCEKLLTAKG